jgi:hypothetical protein
VQASLDRIWSPSDQLFRRDLDRQHMLPEGSVEGLNQGADGDSQPAFLDMFFPVGEKEEREVAKRAIAGVDLDKSTDGVPVVSRP